ncbi:MAG TPA: VWA domain-containing protein, partial [Gemmatimonadetes bacterium]|nr:VWA domain-containing protein [Gemmatimonadota bacterium]
MSVSFEQYWPLLAVIFLPMIWKIGSMTRVKIGAHHLKILGVIRICLIFSLLLALMQPTWHRSVQWLSTVYAIDVSGSIEPTFIRSAIDWISRVDGERKPEHSAFVVFAGSSQTLSSPDQIASVEVSMDGSANSINQSITDIGAGLRQAMNSFQPSYLKRLVLFTDGNANAGEDLDVVMEAREKGVRIFTIPASVVGGNDSWMESLELPEEIRQGEPIIVEVQIYSRTEKDAVIELMVGSQPTVEKFVTLEEGLNPLLFETIVERSGATTISARIDSQSDGTLENNRLDRSVVVKDQPRILYVEGRSESAHYLSEALEMESIEVVLSTPANLPESQLELELFDLIFLSDVSPEDLGPTQMDAVLRYVRDFGGGLVFAAGESSYGKEGYSGSKIEEVLPIWFEVEEERKDLALVIVLDKSYSMVGAKLELSKEAAKAALGIMDDRHRFGVVTFDDTPYVAVPLQLASEESRINQSISQIIAGSQTNIYPALDKAFEILTESEAEVRHVVLLSDGKTYADDYEGLVTRMADEEITVSSVAVGEEADRDLLSDIALWGNGRSYYIQDAQGVPQVFIKEAQIAAQSTLIEERVVFE